MGVSTGTMVETRQVDHAAAELSRRKARSRAMIRNLPIAGTFVDGDTLIVNSAAERLVGYSQAEVPTLKEWFDRLYGERATEIRSAYEADKANYFPKTRSVNLTTSSGEEKFVEFAGHHSPGGEIWLLHDLTPWKATQEALRESESTTRAILETCIDSIVTIDQRGVMVSVNPATEKTFGYSSDELVGQDLSMLMMEPDHSRHGHYLKRYLQGGEAKIIGIGREVLARRKDGSGLPIHLGVGEMHLPKGKFFVGLIRDLTPFKEVQRKLIEAESLAAIGEMAASVAHEIKDPLAAISGVVQVLQDSDAIKEEYREIVSELVNRVERLDDTVKRLLVFAKPTTPYANVVDLYEVTEQVLRGARREDQFTDIRFGIEGSRADARIDLVLYEDLLRNLFYNAADAMPHGGEIQATVKRLDSKASVELSDTGTGMAGEILEKIFQPFFTTRSHGTGLGLAICKKVVEAHGGSISIASQTGRGTRVTMLFPLASGIT